MIEGNIYTPPRFNDDQQWQRVLEQIICRHNENILTQDWTGLVSRAFFSTPVFVINFAVSLSQRTISAGGVDTQEKTNWINFYWKMKF